LQKNLIAQVLKPCTTPPFTITQIIAAVIAEVPALLTVISKNIKAFRLYGLYLSIFSVFKLLLFDIAASNSLLRVFSFIGAGILCFIIVWFYNKMSENDNANQNDNVN
jgi:uncharacterized membrane protein